MKYRLTLFAFGLSIITCLFFWNNEHKVFYGDALGYYSFLPAFAIHNNLESIDNLSKNPNIPEHFRNGISAFKKHYPQNKEGNTVIQYTYGVAAMHAPFFYTVLMFDKLLGNEVSGFEKRYQFAIKISGFIYLILGLFFLYQSLLFYFEKSSAIWTIVLTVLGTNLLWFIFFQFGMAHVPLFFLYAALIYCSILLHKKYKASTLIIISIICGLITIIRPNEILAVIIPLAFYFSSSRFSTAVKHQEFSHFTITLFIAVGCFIVPIIPQLVYWKLLTGSYIFYSYGEQGFNWAQPRIFEGLFGAKNGWFHYTPLMFFAIIGFGFNRMPSILKWIAFLIIPSYIYINYSWWCYNYINGFGSRPMIHIYPLLAFGIALWLNKRDTPLKLAGIVCLIVSSLINLNFIQKQHLGLLFSDESTSLFNYSTFFKDHLSYSDLLASDLDYQFYEDFDSIQILKTVQFDSLSTMIKYDSVEQIFYYDNLANETFPQCNLIHDLTKEDLNSKALKLSCEGLFLNHIFLPYEHHKLVLEIQQIDGNKIYKDVRINDKIAKNRLPNQDIKLMDTHINSWSELHFYYPTENLNIGDHLRLIIWNVGGKTMKIKSLSLAKCW